MDTERRGQNCAQGQSIVSEDLEFPHGCYDSGDFAFNYPVMKSSRL